MRKGLIVIAVACLTGAGAHAEGTGPDAAADGAGLPALRLAQVLLPDRSPPGPLPPEFGAAPPPAQPAPAPMPEAAHGGGTDDDPFSWVEGHLLQFHDPVKYYP